MTTTATHNEHDTTTERVLFVAFELSEKNWKLGFTTGHGQKPRERTVAAWMPDHVDEHVCRLVPVGLAGIVEPGLLRLLLQPRPEVA